MSSQEFEFKAELRQNTGKAAVRRMRRLEDRVPAIIYGGGGKPQTITISHKDISLALENEAIFSHVLKLKIKENSEQVILKDIQRHPYKSKILHIDFQRLKAGEKFVVTVPIHFLNEEKAPGVKAGGIISHLLNEVEVECLPADLPEFLTVDVSQLDAGQSLHLSDIVLPKEVDFSFDLDERHNQPIVSIHMPRGIGKEEAEETKSSKAS